MQHNQKQNDIELYNSAMKYKALPKEDSYDMMIKKSAFEFKRYYIANIEKIFVKEFFDDLIKASEKFIQVPFKVLLQHIYICISFQIKDEPNKLSAVDYITMNIGEFILRCPKARNLLKKKQLKVDGSEHIIPIIICAFDKQPRYWDDYFDWKMLYQYHYDYTSTETKDVYRIRNIPFTYAHEELSLQDQSIFASIFDFSANSSKPYDIQNCQDEIDKYYKTPEARLMIRLPQIQPLPSQMENLKMLIDYLFEVWMQQVPQQKASDILGRFMKSDDQSYNQDQNQNQIQNQSFNDYDPSSLIKRGSSNSDPINIDMLQNEEFEGQIQSPIQQEITISDRSTPQQMNQNNQSQLFRHTPRELLVQNNLQNILRHQYQANNENFNRPDVHNINERNQQSKFDDDIGLREPIIISVDNYIKDLKSSLSLRQKRVNSDMNFMVLENLYIQGDNNQNANAVITQIFQTCNRVNIRIWDINANYFKPHKGQQEIEHELLRQMYDHNDIQNYVRNLSKNCKTQDMSTSNYSLNHAQFISIFFDQIQAWDLSSMIVLEFYTKMLQIFYPTSSKIVAQSISDYRYEDSGKSLSQFVYERLDEVIHQNKALRSNIINQFRNQDLIDLQCLIYKGLGYFILLMQRHIKMIDNDMSDDSDEEEKRDNIFGGGNNEINNKGKALKENVPYIEFKMFFTQRENSLKEYQEGAKLLVSKDINNSIYADMIEQLPIQVIIYLYANQFVQVQQEINEKGFMITLNHIRLYCEPTILQIKDFPFYDLLLYRMIQVHSNLTLLKCEEQKGNILLEGLISESLVTLPFFLYNEKEELLTDFSKRPPTQYQTFSDCKIPTHHIKMRPIRKSPFWRQADQVMWLFNTIMEQYIYTSRDIFIMLSTLANDPSIPITQIVQEIRYPLVYNDPFPLQKLSQLMLFDKKTMKPKRLALISEEYGADLSDKLNYIDDYITEHKALHQILITKTEPLIVEIFFTYKTQYHGRMIVIVSQNKQNEMVITTTYKGERILDTTKKQPSNKYVHNRFLKLIEENPEGATVKIFSVRFYKVETEYFQSIDKIGNQFPLNIFKFRNMMIQFFMKFSRKDLKQALNLIDGLGIMGVYIFNKATPFDCQGVQPDWIQEIDVQKSLVDKVIDNVSKINFLKHNVFPECKTYVQCLKLYDLMNSVMTTYRTSIDLTYQDMAKSTIIPDYFQYILCERLKEVSWTGGKDFIEWIDSTLWQYYNNFQFMDIKIFKTCVTIIKNFLNRLRLREFYIYGVSRDFKPLQTEFRYTQPGDYSDDDEIMKDDFIDDQKDLAKKTEAEIQTDQQSKLMTQMILRDHKVVRFRRIIKIFQSAFDNLIDFYRKNKIHYPQKLRNDFHKFTNDDQTYFNLSDQPLATYEVQSVQGFGKLEALQNQGTENTASADEEERKERKEEAKRQTDQKLSNFNDDQGSNSFNKRSKQPQKKRRKSSNQDQNQIQSTSRETATQKEYYDERWGYEQNPYYYEEAYNQTSYNSAHSYSQPQADLNYDYHQYPTSSNSSYTPYPEVQHQNMFGTYNPGGQQYQSYSEFSPSMQVAQRQSFGVVRRDYDSQRPAFEQARPIYEQHRSSFQQPRPHYDQPRPHFEQPRPYYEQPRPHYDQHRPVFQQPRPQYEQPRPVQYQPRPVYQEQRLVQEAPRQQQNHQRPPQFANQRSMFEQPIQQEYQQSYHYPASQHQVYLNRPPLAQPQRNDHNQNQNQNISGQHFGAPNDKKSGDRPKK